MKTKLFFLLAATMLFSATAKAQVAEEPAQIRYNQYGVAVNRNKLMTEERNGILVFESADGSYRFWFDCRAQVDGAVFFGQNPDFDPIGNGVSIRRARFAVKAQINEDWYGEVDTDFANGKFELKDALLKYTGLDNFEFQAGNFKEGFSMESTTTSRYLSFIERPMIVSAFAPSRHIGIQAKYNNKYFFVSAGTFFQAVEDLEVRTNVEDNNKDFGRDAGISYTGKLVATPFGMNPNYGLHIGAAASYRTPKADMATGEYGGVRYSSRATTGINRKKYLDTDVIKNVDHDMLMGAEFAGYCKGFRFQSEYIRNNTYIKDEANTTYSFNGWYAYVGYMLFGGQARYNAAEGEFTQPVRGQEWGDVELVARYEYANLNSGNIYGGAAQAYSAGLTFYVNNNEKIKLNYQYTDNDRYANGKNKLFTGYDAEGAPTKDFTKMVTPDGQAGVDFNMVALRMEIDF